MLCRKNDLLASVRSKQKLLDKLLAGADPRDGISAIKADITKLHKKMTAQVLPRFNHPFLEVLIGRQAFVLC